MAFCTHDFPAVQPNQRTSGPADQRISGPADQRISGPADQRISGPADQQISGSADPADQRTSRSADQRIQRTSGPADQRIQRTSGSADQPSGSDNPTIISSVLGVFSSLFSSSFQRVGCKKTTGFFASLEYPISQLPPVILKNATCSNDSSLHQSS